MKKVIIICVLIVQGLNGFSQTFPKGTKSFSAGFGVISYENIVLKIIANQLNFKSSNTGPFYIKGEYAVADNFTLGLNVNYSKISATFNVDSVKYTGNMAFGSTSVILRANYMLSVADENGGIYFGGGLGYRGGKLSYYDDNPYKDLKGDISVPLPFTFEATIGYKYYFTPNIGVYAEMGATRSLFQAGVSARF